ncbi:MAG: CinA family protein, partial [Victivallales bacterium]|nr:CinA family protein [Victivallales bacterium]
SLEIFILSTIDASGLHWRRWQYSKAKEISVVDDNMRKDVVLLGKLLKARNATIATAESCTGGGIAAAMTEVPGSSEWFMGGFVTYSNEWKMARLGVSFETLAKHGAVSSQTVSEMLSGLLKVGGTDLGVAVSGIAGPGGGTPEKPVGTVYVGIADGEWQDVRLCHFPGDRQDVRNATVDFAVKLLLEHLR